MMIFNILMLMAFVLLMSALIMPQVYVIIDSYKEYKEINHFRWIFIILGMSFTLLATVLFVVAITIYLFKS